MGIDEKKFEIGHWWEIKPKTRIYKSLKNKKMSWKTGFIKVKKIPQKNLLPFFKNFTTFQVMTFLDRFFFSNEKGIVCRDIKLDVLTKFLEKQ